MTRKKDVHRQKTANDHLNSSFIQSTWLPRVDLVNLWCLLVVINNNSKLWWSVKQLTILVLSSIRENNWISIELSTTDNILQSMFVEHRLPRIKNQVVSWRVGSRNNWTKINHTYQESKSSLVIFLRFRKLWCKLTTCARNKIQITLLRFRKLWLIKV